MQGWAESLPCTIDRPLDFDELMECVKMYKVMASIAPEPYQSRPENYIKLRPRGVGERGGYFCMPLKKNVPEGHTELENGIAFARNGGAE